MKLSLVPYSSPWHGGNERADALAKAATKHPGTEFELLVPFSIDIKEIILPDWEAVPTTSS